MSIQDGRSRSSVGDKESSSIVEDAVTGVHPRTTEGFTFEEDTPEEKKLLRKIDMFLLPTIWIVYLLSYMVRRDVAPGWSQLLTEKYPFKDRSNIGNARVAGMGDDLALNDDRYYLVVVLFQVGYVVAEVPSNMILARSRPSLFIPALMLFWGATCAIIAAVQTWQQLVGLRFLLGIAEAGFSVWLALDRVHPLSIHIC